MIDYYEKLDHYIIDVYIDVGPRYKVWLIDINPWIKGCADSLLFDWEELESKYNETNAEMIKIEIVKD